MIELMIIFIILILINFILGFKIHFDAKKIRELKKELQILKLRTKPIPRINRNKK